ncbi:hypothetical protein ACHQM5_025391 [Ranunculus cassubicifolius]
MVLSLFLQLSFTILLFLSASATPVDFSGAKPACETKCGNITVPYPFGIGVECARSKGHSIICNSTYNPPKPFIQDGNNDEIVGISPTEVRITNTVAFRCYNQSGGSSNWSENWTHLAQTPYTFSEKSNRFISVGCNIIAFMQDYETGHSTSGCLSLCTTIESLVSGSCLGNGCCQTPIPKGLKHFGPHITRPYPDWHNETFSYSPCSYAFLADHQKFSFQPSDIYALSFFNTTREVPVVLDWVIDNITCKDAKRNSSSYACMKNTDCVDSDNGPGYRCSCRDGYEGNPYLTPGCHDIDECEDPNKNMCLSPSNCVNLPGTYNCTCPLGTYGDGRNNGRGCIPESKEVPYIAVTLGVGLGLLFVLVATYWLYYALNKRRAAKLRAKFFEQNGGLLLQQHLLSSQDEGGAVKLTRLYTAAELKEATNNYDESRILGRGGNGVVYKGIFPRHKTIVAIKKSQIVDKSQIEQFINEVVILTQINHRNVVKLLGCCLETEIPLLVYEYICNGTLYDHIHKRGLWSKLSWQNRLRIATETAGALGYLHSAASIPIIHRDVKSANILLDDNYNAKVADFGASRLIPLDQTQISTLVQGTLGYLDPEYFRTSKLTEKSDVYSFGVLLVELLTGEKPLSFERSEERRNLTAYFLVSMQENTLLNITEEHLIDEVDNEQVVSVAKLAMRCLNLRGEERPTMKQVLRELESVMKISEQYPWVKRSKQVTRRIFLDEPSQLEPVKTLDHCSNDSVGPYSLEDSMMLSMNLPR